MKSNTENNNDNIPEPGQTEMKDEEEQQFHQLHFNP
ncbi:hypothetical protein QF044_001229 [Chryseobacterium sp. W4I1]|nr:hypothetical protein [Chryseobacterium sp. W4I1]